MRGKKRTFKLTDFSFIILKINEELENILKFEFSIIFDFYYFFYIKSKKKIWIFFSPYSLITNPN